MSETRQRRVLDRQPRGGQTTRAAVAGNLVARCSFQVLLMQRLVYRALRIQKADGRRVGGGTAGLVFPTWVNQAKKKKNAAKLGGWVLPRKTIFFLAQCIKKVWRKYTTYRVMPGRARRRGSWLAARSAFRFERKLELFGLERPPARPRSMHPRVPHDGFSTSTHKSSICVGHSHPVRRAHAPARRPAHAALFHAANHDGMNQINQYRGVEARRVSSHPQFTPATRTTPRSNLLSLHPVSVASWWVPRRLFPKVEGV